jgi:hypothetical protein
MPEERRDVPIMDLPPPPGSKVIAELERELRKRATVYPVMIFKKTLRAHEAEHRNACLRKAIADLREFYEGTDAHGR